jgi:hypothetical protein
MTKFIAFGLFGLAGYLLWREFHKKDDLQVHAEEEKQLQHIGFVATNASQASLNDYPLSTIGDTPFAGVSFDPFNPNSIASKPKTLDMYPGLISY